MTSDKGRVPCVHNADPCNTVYHRSCSSRPQSARPKDRSPGRLLGAQPDDPARHAGVAAYRLKGGDSCRPTSISRFVHQSPEAALGDELQVPVALGRCGLRRLARHRAGARRHDHGRPGMVRRDRGVDVVPVERAVAGEGGDGTVDPVEQGTDLRAVVGIPVGQHARDDLAARAAAPASSLAALTTSAAFRRLHATPTRPGGTIAPPPRPQSLSYGMFSTWPHALQCTASGSWRCSPHCGQGCAPCRPGGRRPARAGRTARCPRSSWPPRAARRRCFR